MMSSSVTRPNFSQRGSRSSRVLLKNGPGRFGYKFLRVSRFVHLRFHWSVFAALITVGEVAEKGVFGDPANFDGSRGAVALLGDDDFGFAFRIGVGVAVAFAVVVAFAVDEGDDVGVLLDGAGLAEVGEERLLFSAALLGGARELRERENGDVEFFGEGFEAAGDGGNFLGAVFVAASLRTHGTGGHELEVVDDDEVEAALGLAESAGFGAHFSEGDTRGIVDKERRFDQAFEGVDEALAIFAWDESGLDFLRADVRLGGEHAAEERLLRHFEREDGDFLATLDGGVLRDVDGEGGFAHGGAGGDDGELGLLQAAAHLVELREVSAEAGDLVLSLLVEVVDGFEGAGDDIVDAGEAAGDALLSDFEERGFGGVEDIEGSLALVGCAGNGAGTDVDELAEERFVLDDADVFFDGKAAGQAFGERGDPRDATDGRDLLAAGEFFAEGDDVDDVILVNEFAHAGEDALMGGEGKIVGAQGGGGFAVGVVVEEDGAEDGAFGVEGSGEAALKFDVGGSGHGLQRV